MKYERLEQLDDKSFSQWTTPNKNGYKLACCDCGLVHDMEFFVLLKNGKHLDGRKYQIKFRARRNKRATAAVRRNKK